MNEVLIKKKNIISFPTMSDRRQRICTVLNKYVLLLFIFIDKKTKTKYQFFIESFIDVQQ
jgi:hypothetical protein